MWQQQILTPASKTRVHLVNNDGQDVTIPLIVVRRRPRHGTQAVVTAGGRHLRAALGRGSTSVFKREGDGATPAMAPLVPLALLYRRDRVMRPASTLPVRRIRADDGWCDAPGHRRYNAPVRLPFTASHEVMRRDDHLYDLCVILDWNMAGASRRGRASGSAIFMHLARPDYGPTAGCIALGRRDLAWLVARIGPSTRILVQR